MSRSLEDCIDEIKKEFKRILNVNITHDIKEESDEKCVIKIHTRVATEVITLDLKLLDNGWNIIKARGPLNTLVSRVVNRHKRELAESKLLHKL